MHGQKLSSADTERRVQCARRMLRRITVNKVGRIFFTDEKIFRVDPPWNNQNDRLYASVSKKSDIDEDRLFVERNHFSPGIMVSVGVSKLGKTSLIFVDPEAKVTGQYYRDRVLTTVLPECAALSGDLGYTFQQDGGRAHTAKDTIAFLKEKVPDLLEPENWPANSPDRFESSRLHHLGSPGTDGVSPKDQRCVSSSRSPGGFMGSTFARNHSELG